MRAVVVVGFAGLVVQIGVTLLELPVEVLDDLFFFYCGGGFDAMAC